VLAHSLKVELMGTQAHMVLDAGERELEYHTCEEVTQVRRFPDRLRCWERALV